MLLIQWPRTSLAQLVKASRLAQRQVPVLCVESHVGWQGLKDGIVGVWTYAGNEIADDVAKRDADRAGVPELEAQSFLRMCALNGPSVV